MAYFLLVYEQIAGKLLRMREFADEQRDAAMAERFELELSTAWSRAARSSF